MGRDGYASASVFATRLDHLLRNRTADRTGRAWTTRSLSEALRQRGHQMSHTKIGRLRRGESQPVPADIEALAAVLDVPIRYFFPDPHEDDGERRVLAAMAAGPHVHAVAMRPAEHGPISEKADEAIKRPHTTGSGQPTWPRRPARLAHAVVELLVDRIAGGDFPPGTLLPTEQEMCESFGVSRTTVREAVKSLEAKGLALARQGSGTTVTSPDRWNLLDPMVLAAAVRHDAKLVILDQLVAVRSALESQMAATAATRATEDELAAIRHTLGLLDEQASTPDQFTDTDVELHDLIMRASGNTLGRSIVGIVHAHARTTRLYTGIPDAAACGAANDEHRVIVERLEARDAVGAAQAMSSHIEQAWSRRRTPGVQAGGLADGVLAHRAQQG